ncbi:MAG: putative metal-binding motif-containing protein, partial [Myxococcales bacterium]|nr:putative metal-binding motif-containing protein [Myxococcales bacterium]
MAARHETRTACVTPSSWCDSVSGNLTSTLITASWSIPMPRLASLLLLLAACAGDDKSAADDTGVPVDTDADTDSDTDADTDSDTDSDTDLDADGYASDVDCDDTNPDIHPDALDRCDGVDDDCDPLGGCRWSGELSADASWASDTPIHALSGVDLDDDGTDETV